jgi:hypothetical protein
MTFHHLFLSFYSTLNLNRHEDDAGGHDQDAGADVAGVGLWQG